MTPSSLATEARRQTWISTLQDIEDRASRSEDGTHGNSSDDTSDDYRADFNQALTQTIAALSTTDAALINALLALQAGNKDGKIKIERNGMEIEI